SKKSHQSDEEEVSQEDEEDEPVAKKPYIEDTDEAQDGEEDKASTTGGPRRNEDHGVLRICLKHIQKSLQKKDVNGFFAYPVNDMIAPGYSSIILSPMDFSTMMNKIENNEYRNVMEYKKDFVLMCNNAMTYNRPETIYYKEAKRLIHVGIKQMSKDKLIHMKKTLPFLASMKYEELGVDEPDDTKAVVEAVLEEEQREMERAKDREKIGRFEAVPDNLSPEEILAQAQAAAKDAAEMLTLRQPRSKFGFLRRRSDGSTSMTLLNPDNDGIVSETEKVVNLGSIIGKLTSGSGTISGFKEDKRNRVTPVTYLNYGPFSSYGPSYDSTFANVSKEESDLLLSTYGDETGIQYSKSVMSFVENSGDYAEKMVDHLLDILTKGEHTKTQKILSQKKGSQDGGSGSSSSKSASQSKERKSPSPASSTAGSQDNKPQQNIDFDSLKSLGDLGVDVSFLDDFKDSIKPDPMQEKLDQTAGLLKDLQQTQNERLSLKPPSHLSHVPGPSEKEVKLGNIYLLIISSFCIQATPSDVSSVQGLRSAMGITLHTVKNEPMDEPVTTCAAETDSQLTNQVVDNTDNEPSVTNDQEMFSTNQNAFDSAITNQNIDDNEDDDKEIDISEFLQFPSQT
ncbi:hypothetical protein FSP39_009255, partial [Pinctada imbricata]